jgi:archaellum biogenesis protein FlaJ (TadC family)
MTKKRLPNSKWKAWQRNFDSDLTSLELGISYLSPSGAEALGTEDLGDLTTRIERVYTVLAIMKDSARIPRREIF